MKLSFVLFALACCLCLTEGKKSSSSNGGGGGGNSTNYAENRKKVFDTIDFSKAPCVSDPSPAKFGQYGCCPDPGSLPAFEKGWSVEFLDRLDALCIEPSKGGSFELKFKVVPGKGKHDAEALFA